MDIMIIIQMILAALGAIFIYTLIGFIPGTDETSVLMPITLTVVLSGVPPIVILTFFIAAIVTLNLTNSIPTALVGLPGGVMSSPMLEHSLLLKDEGMSAIVIKKMAVGAVIGTVISIPIALLLSNVLAPYGAKLQEIGPLLFVLGAIFLSLVGKNKILSLISIIPMAILFMALRHLYWGIGIVPKDTNITTSFFLGITIGPLIVSLLNLLNKDIRTSLLTKDKKQIEIPDDSMDRTLNPLKILNKDEIKRASISALISNFLFVLSPVGLTILIGEAVSNRIEDPINRATTAITSMSALIQSTYIYGIIIPLIAIGIALSAKAIGPAVVIFNVTH